MTIIETAAELLDMVVKAEIIHDETIAEAIARAERAEAALAQCQVWRQEEADSLNHCIRAKQQAEAYAADRESEAKACHNIMAECRTIAGDSHTGTVDAVRGLLARAERAEASLVECASNGLKLREELADVYRRAERSEAALAERDEPCVWRYKRYGGWFSICGVRPENWNTAWRYCPFCGHPLHAPSDNDLLPDNEPS